MTTLEADGLIDDRRARRNAVVLAAAQALFGIVMTSQFTLGGLVGAGLAPAAHKAFATLPISLMVLANATVVIPAAFFMRRHGRRAGFLLSAAAAIVAMAIACVALMRVDFVMFCAGSALLGVHQAFSGYFRFAAADTASDGFRAKAISWVLAGGVAAAVLGPEMVKHTADLFAVPYLGSYAALIVVGALSLAVAALVDIPRLDERTISQAGRPLGEIMRQPTFVVAVMAGLTAYGLMNLVMTATPLAMIGCGFSVADAAFVIQWHALAMYVPSFFTGHIIARVGLLKVIGLGMALLAGCAAVTLAGIEIENFWFGLVLLGLGWNFGFVGATTLLTECYRPAERAKVQATNDFLVFGAVALASFSSGGLFFSFGWASVIMAVWPFVAIAALAIAWLGLHRRKQGAARA